jgi:hypothetical protein
MAESPAHRFGQLIGELLESVVLPNLEEFCRQQGLYLDHQKRSRAVRRGKKVSLTDGYGNVHDLDFVIERGGSDTVYGEPIAFIEVAWRRYTKHSRNKAQEIQGAILPLADKFRWNNPFLGTVLAGEFTESSLEQLRSQGFHVLFLPYITLIKAFDAGGIDIRFGEDTPDSVFQRAIDQIAATTPERMTAIRTELVRQNADNQAVFFDALARRLRRLIVRAVVIPLYGHVNEFATIEAAVNYLEQHPIYEGSGEFRRYEVRIDFSNGDTVNASFAAKVDVIHFLEFVSQQ